MRHKDDVVVDQPDFEVPDADDDFKQAEGLLDYGNEEDFGIKKALGFGNPIGGEAHAFADLFIHQMIETIEFVLGTISNTASYLRLWALSLAHSQLAKVFFDQVLVPFMSSGSVIGCFIAFFVFMAATTAVLMMMDVMECGLHTLRLHWVEF
jgi:vacuolar-type H+-ATPase subunit I/STV1